MNMTSMKHKSSGSRNHGALFKDDNDIAYKSLPRLDKEDDYEDGGDFILEDLISQSMQEEEDDDFRRFD